MADNDLFLLTGGEIKDLTGWPDVIIEDYVAATQSIEDILRPEGWHEIGEASEPAFENSWQNFSATYDTAAFYKDALGIVRLKGGVSTGASATTAFTLPENYRPTKRLWLVTVGSAGAIARVIIEPSGTVSPAGSTASSFTSLEGLSFRVIN